MHLSVVVPTLNGRERLAACLDALAARAPEAEVVVVNGPSTDGTTGMVRDRDDIDVLVEISERNINCARNAGIEAASGDAVAFLDDGLRVEPGWAEAVREALHGADAVTGPRHEELEAGIATSGVGPESQGVCGREVTYFDGGNVAVRRPALTAIDGFDEYLQTGGARDAAHRLAGRGRKVTWTKGMSVRQDYEADGGSGLRTDVPRPNATAAELEPDWGWKFRSLAYRLTKNYGVRPAVWRRVFGHAAREAYAEAKGVAGGEGSPTGWVATGRTVLANIGRGSADGVRARYGDRSRTRNPSGLSDRDDRAVETYDWR